MISYLIIMVNETLIASQGEFLPLTSLSVSGNWLDLPTLQNDVLPRLPNLAILNLDHTGICILALLMDLEKIKQLAGFVLESRLDLS